MMIMLYVGNQFTSIHWARCDVCLAASGTFKWASGAQYEGEWRDGKRTGRGELFFLAGIYLESDLVILDQLCEHTDYRFTVTRL